MGLLDKLKGHKKDESVKSFDEAAEKKHARSNSLGRKSVEQGRVTKEQNVPSLPGHEHSTSATTGTVPVAAYPVAETSAVGGHAAHDSHSRTDRPAIPDNLSTAAIKDGTTGETEMNGLSRDMQRSTLNSSEGTGAHSYQPFSYGTKDLTQTPFDRDAFHRSLGSGTGTTTYESITKAAVVQETIHSNVREEIHPVFHREHHVMHHQTRIQPVLEQVFLPARHYVLIDGQKHEITGDAVMNHVVKARDFIPMSGATPKVTVHQYVDHEPLIGPVTGVGASLINKDVMLEHQRLINSSYEHKAAGREHGIPTGSITTVNYLPGQVPVSTEPGVGPSSLAESSVAGRHASHPSSSGHASSGGRLNPDDAIERTAQRLPEQRAAMY